MRFPLIVAAVLVTAACGRGDGVPRTEPESWFVVDREVNRAVGGQTIHHQGPSAPALLNPPAGDRAQFVIVTAVVSADGRIARATILRRPRKEVTEADVIALLRPLRFRPATLDGRPVAVYYSLTLPVPRHRRADSAP